MKLLSARIANFQCIQDSNEFEVDDITCLVGKNESGKTAILKAIYYLNPVVPNDGFRAESDYPRKSYAKFLNLPDEKAEEHVIEAEFIYEKSDIEILKTQFGEGLNCNKNTKIRVSKDYNNKLSCLDLDINEEHLLKHIISQIVGEEAILNDIITTDASNISSYLRQNYTSLLLPESAETENDINRVLAILSEIEAYGILQFVEKEIHKLIPKFMYFDEYHNIKGEENLNSLLIRKENRSLSFPDYALIGLFELANLTIENLLNPSTTEEMFNRLEVAADIVSKQVFEYWSQNTDIELKFERQPGTSSDPPGLENGMNIFGRIIDKRYGVSTSLSNRSRGFLWFFSFSALYQKLCNDYDSLILLLDEPGLSLHASAQADLLNFFENKLKPNHQIIYSTHSPFMINSKKIDRVRIVQNSATNPSSPKDIEKQGSTEVISDVLEADSGAIFPLQGALGYEITQSLFIGSNCLVVEGVSDMLYLQSVSAFLQSQNFSGLSDSWTITPVGGISKVSTFVSLLGYQKDLNIAVLLDYCDSDADQIKNLYKKKLLQKDKVIVYSEVAEMDEATIEDLFCPSTYLMFINAVFDLSLEATDLLKSNKIRILEKLTDLANENPSISDALKMKQGRFNHYRPAEYFMKEFDCSRLEEKELERFKRLFSLINELCN